MAVYHGSVCRLCRREGTKLFLKGERCLSTRCAIERRSYPPGLHGQGRRPKKPTEYGLQLREKQKARRIYGLLEKQFRNTFHKAVRKKGITGEVFLQLLEKRLDNVIYRLGFAVNRRQSRQLVGHKHIMVNGKMLNFPSYVVCKGDVIEVAGKSRKLPNFVERMENRGKLALPSWLSVTEGELKGAVIDDPKTEDIALPVNEQLIVEYYSK